ncbi:MAG TPA: hypothetical protein VD913_03065, partial [bacterium]|nr:hypothetical protein [bacterium]
GNMSNLLIRGLQPRIRREIQKLAEAENLSINQEVLRLIAWALEQAEKQRVMEEERAEAFRRIREIREANFRKYGVTEDSTKLIREDRDSR